MRERLRARSMARRPGGEGRFNLSPRWRWIAGWVVAILLIGGVALAFNLAGGNADGTAVATPSPSAVAQQGGITFGTNLGPTRAVAPGSATTRFAAGDTFAYSVSVEGSPPPVVYVEVVTADGARVAQSVDEGEQSVPPGEAIGFNVPADLLLDAFGPGSYVMRIYPAPGAEPLAVGSFELVSTASSPAASGG